MRLSYSLNAPRAHYMKGCYHGITTTEEQHH